LKVDLEQDSWVMSELSEVGIDLKKVTKTLENDGVKKILNLSTS
jgi:hypothetical protein